MKFAIIPTAIILLTCVVARPISVNEPLKTGFYLNDKQDITDKREDTVNVLEKTRIGPLNGPFISRPYAPEQMREFQKPKFQKTKFQKPQDLTKNANLKSKQATILLSSMEKLRRIKHNRNRKVRLNYLKAQRSLQNRRYLQLKPGKRTRKQLPDLALSLVNGHSEINNHRDKANQQKFYKRILCDSSRKHRFCKKFRE